MYFMEIDTRMLPMAVSPTFGGKRSQPLGRRATRPSADDNRRDKIHHVNYVMLWYNLPPLNAMNVKTTDLADRPSLYAQKKSGPNRNGVPSLHYENSLCSGKGLLCHVNSYHVVSYLVCFVMRAVSAITKE